MGAHAAKGEPGWREQIDGQWKNRANNSGIGAIFNAIGSIISNVTSIIGSIGDLFDIANTQGAKIDVIEDGQLGLNSRVDLLSPMEDYGATYAAGEGGVFVNGTGVKNFDRQTGPMVGCHLSGGRIVLEDQGLWEITARMSFSWTALSGDLIWYVRILRPDGSIFSQQVDRCTTKEETTRHITTTVVVPTPNYSVEVYVSTIVGGREIFGGPTHNRLIVHHMSRSTANPI
ncbi:MAG: hypothetical protein WA998_00505 [Gordonia sp. (in: high G+C Gram-positive bacteria)]